jgi:hypothetical protein
MGNTVIERDADAQEKFGLEVKEFYTNMLDTCKTLKGHVTEASPYIGSENAHLALQYILEMLEAIEGTLPDVEAFGDKQIKQAKKLRDADDTKFSTMR